MSLVICWCKSAKIPCFNAAVSDKVEYFIPSSHNCLFFAVSVLLSFVFSILFVTLKMHILYLKMQTQDHFWSRAHFEVASLSVPRKKHIQYLLKLNCDFSSKSKFSPETHIKNLVFSCRLLLFCFLADLQDSSQIGLLKELLDLQKDMVVMLLSLLEGMLSVSVCMSSPFCCIISKYFLSPLTFYCSQAMW